MRGHSLEQDAPRRGEAPAPAPAPAAAPIGTEDPGNEPLRANQSLAARQMKRMAALAADADAGGSPGP